MRINFLSRIAAAALFVALAAVAASAQVIRVEGKVTLKQADGTETPVQGAVVDIYRLDVAGKFEVKTDRNGRFVHAGIPLGRSYTIAVSAPGARQSYVWGVPLAQQPEQNFTLEPGNGARLTLDQIKAAQAGGGGPANTAGGAAASGGMSKEDKAKAEEMKRQVAEAEAKNEKIRQANEVVKRTFEAGNVAIRAKRYDEAIAAYDEGLRADPEVAVLYLNKSYALRSRGVDRFNEATKAKDTAGKETARADFKAAAEASEQAVKYYRSYLSTRGGGAPAAGAPAQKDESLDYLLGRAESYRLALQTSTPVSSDQAVTAIQEYIAAETDPAKKAKAQASLGEALFQGGRIDEAIAAYRQILSSSPDNLDAMYGLGIALAADPSGTKTAEGRDMLKKFASKAQPTDPRKQMAEEAVAGLDEALKPKPADKSSDANRGGRRRRP